MEEPFGFGSGPGELRQEDFGGNNTNRFKPRI